MNKNKGNKINKATKRQIEVIYALTYSFINKDVSKEVVKICLESEKNKLTYVLNSYKKHRILEIHLTQRDAYGEFGNIKFSNMYWASQIIKKLLLYKKDKNSIKFSKI